MSDTPSVEVEIPGRSIDIITQFWKLCVTTSKNSIPDWTVIKAFLDKQIRGSEAAPEVTPEAPPEATPEVTAYSGEFARTLKEEGVEVKSNGELVRNAESNFTILDRLAMVGGLSNWMTQPEHALEVSFFLQMLTNSGVDVNSLVDNVILGVKAHNSSHGLDHRDMGALEQAYERFKSPRKYS